MKITRRQLRRIIKEAIDVDTDGDGALDPDELRDLAGDLESRSKEAIVGAQSLRADGTSFEDFTTELLDYLEDKTGITWNEEQLPDDINYYDAWLSGENPSSIGAEYLQDASDLYRENKVKITRGQLRQIIKETLLTEKNENPSWNLYKYTGDVWTKY